MLDFAEAYGYDEETEKQNVSDVESAEMHENETIKAKEEERLKQVASEERIEKYEHVICNDENAVCFMCEGAKKRTSKEIEEKISKIKALSNLRLWRLYIKLKTENRPALTTIVKTIIYERYLPSVISVADSYSRRRLPQRSLAVPEDIKQAAVIAHLEGIDLYSPEFGTTYMQYLNTSGNRSRITGRIIDALRKLQHFPRDVSRKRREWKEKMEALSHKLCKTPTIEEMIDEYGNEVNEILSEQLFDKVVVNQMDGIDDEAKSIDSFTENQRVSRRFGEEPKGYSTAIDDILDLIPYNEIKFVIKSYYFDGLTNGEIANKIGKSISTVSSLRRRGEAIILSKVTREEFEALLGN